MDQWRLINDKPTTGARNMARDEAILSAVGAGTAPPTLRLYGWNPPCLSLGYGQRARDADVSRLEAREWDVVRRLTGGRAILHTDELTYSVCTPLDHPLAANGVIESYFRISTPLMEALQKLGAQVAAERAENAAVSASAVCFDQASHYEITVGGRKLVGSAQVRRKNALLQHGTLPLTGDITRVVDALVYPDAAAREAARAMMRQRALTLADALGGQVMTWQNTANILATTFAQAFALEWVDGFLSVSEHAHAEQLARDVYATPEWIFRR